MSTFAGLCPHCGGAGMRAAFAAYDCHGGPGTTQDACGACVTCLLREIEKKDARIKALEVAPAKLIEAINSVQDWSGTYVGECIDEIEGGGE